MRERAMASGESFDGSRRRSKAIGGREMSIAVDSTRWQSGDACCAGRRRRLRCRRRVRTCPAAGGVVDASPEVAPGAVAHAHNAAAFGAGGCVFVYRAALGAFFFDARRRHALGKSAFFNKRFAMLFEKAVDHVQGSTNEDEHRISKDDVGMIFRLLSIAVDGSREPRCEFLSLGYDMLSEVVVDVGAVIGGIKSDGIDGACLRGALRPRRKVFVEKISKVVVAQFTEARLGYINEFKRRLHRSGEAFAPFGKVFYTRAGGLSHLVKLATAGITAKRKKTPAEYERFKLDDVQEYISVKTLVTGRRFKKFSHIENFSKVERRKARRVK